MHCGLFDVSEMSHRLQNIYSLSWKARDSFYLLVSIIAMQTFCTKISCVSSCLLQFASVFCAVDRHVISNLPQTASLVSVRALGSCMVRYALWRHAYWHVLVVLLSPSNRMPGKISPRIPMFLEKLIRIFKNPRILWNKKVNCHLYNSLQVFYIQRLINPIHAISIYFCRTWF